MFVGDQSVRGYNEERESMNSVFRTERMNLAISE